MVLQEPTSVLRGTRFGSSVLRGTHFGSLEEPTLVFQKPTSVLQGTHFGSSVNPLRSFRDPTSVLRSLEKLTLNLWGTDFSSSRNLPRSFGKPTSVLRETYFILSLLQYGVKIMSYMLWIANITSFMPICSIMGQAILNSESWALKSKKIMIFYKILRFSVIGKRQKCIIWYE